MPNFPQELLFRILFRLLPKDLIRYICVSKSWYAFIHDPQFIKAHLESSIKTNTAFTILLAQGDKKSRSTGIFSLAFNDDSTFGTAMKIEQPLKFPDSYTEILGYSNGLVCIQNTSYNFQYNIALWNPSIQKFKEIPCTTFGPQPSTEVQEDITIREIYGFGYDSANDDYKLLVMEETYQNNIVQHSQVRVYSLKSNSWKRIENMPCKGFEIDQEIPVSVNNALCWLICEEKDDFDQDIVLTFDLGSEKYCKFPTPVCKDYNSMTIMDVMGGLLCICVNLKTKNDVWVMKEYGVTKSWTLLYSIPQEAVPWELLCEKPLLSLRNGEIVLFTNAARRSDSNRLRLYWYDLEKKRGKKGKIPGLSVSDQFISFPTVCVGSLCLLDGDPVTSQFYL